MSKLINDDKANSKNRKKETWDYLNFVGYFFCIFN